MTLMIEWTSEQFSEYNDNIEDLRISYGAAADWDEKNAILARLVGMLNEFITIGQADIVEIAARPGTREVVNRYTRNIQTLESMGRAIESGNWDDLKPHAGSMGPIAFPKGRAAPDAPFSVVMGFLANMQLVGLGLGVQRGSGGPGGRGPREDAEKDVCPVCESEMCRCCPKCKRHKCVCEQIASNRIKLMAEFLED
jgi:hypothetical protein